MDDETLEELEKIGKFEVQGVLGQGSFGVVYKGLDPIIQREVAIKVCTLDDEGLRKRFAREARISGNLQHKNIVTVFAADLDENGVPYLVQELLEGEDLDDVIRRRAPLTARQKIDYLLQAAQGLAHAHAHGVIHRDIKPANVRLLDDGTVKIMDFGIAKLASAETQLTQKGVTMGTASYLPPEQVRGGDLDHRADIFSFGVLAYELLTYERPFRGNTLSALIYQILYKVPVPMSAVWPDCPEELADLVARCLEKKPEARFKSVEELTPKLTHLAEEIDGGRWPALKTVSPAADAGEATLADESVGVMSESLISRTAREIEVDHDDVDESSTQVERLPTGETPALETVLLETADLETAALETAALETAALETVPPTPEAPPVEVATRLFANVETPPEDDVLSSSDVLSTLPIPIQPRSAPAEKPPEPPPSEPPPPPPEPPQRPARRRVAPDAPTVKISKEDLLATRAQQISNLIAQGDLEKARQQLDETQQQVLETPPPAAKATPPPPAATTPTERVPTKPRESGGRRSGGRLATPQRPTKRAAPAAPSAASHPARMRWPIAAAVGVVLVVLVGLTWAFFPSGDEPATPPPPPGPGAPGAPTFLGTVTVTAIPWAELTEITDADGYVRELPDEVMTPLRLELPPGRYQLHFSHPDQETVATCEVEVGEGLVVPCTVELLRPEVTDYFVEMGWWQ